MNDEPGVKRRKGISRRMFLRGSGAAVAATTFAAAGVACEENTPSGTSQGVATYQGTAESFYDLNSPEPPASPDSAVYHFFTSDEAKIANALFGRILPGDASDPGAIECGVITYVDYRLATNDGFDQPTYRSAPFAATYEGSPPPEANDPNARFVYVAKDELDRYGFQSILTPREIYRSGLASLDNYARGKFGQGFADLSPDQQDAIVGDLADGKTGSSPGGGKYFNQPTDKSFFKEARTDVVNGMFSDPAYGGNKDMAGWLLISYPGAQRGFTASDMLAEQTRPPQSIAQLEAFHAGHSEGFNTILPVSSGDPDQYSGHRTP